MAEAYIEYHIQKFFEELKIYVHYFNITFSEQKKLAKAIQDKHDEIGSDFDYENDDDGTVWSRAHEEILGTDEVWITEHELFIVGGYCIIIFHAFERFLEELFELIIKHQLSSMLISKITQEQKKAIEEVVKNDKLETFDCFCRIFPDIRKAKGYEKVYELNTICNVFKHGRGGALRRLKKIRPDITQHLGEMFSPALRPFRGYDLTNIKQNMIYEYVDAIKTFLTGVFGVTEVKA